MRSVFFFIAVIIFLSGCSSSKNIKLTPNLKLTSRSIHINAPESLYGTAWEAWYLDSEKHIQLFRHLPSMMSENVNITVTTHPQEDIVKVSMLYKDKNDAMEEHYQNYKISDWEKKNNAERGVGYVKRYVDFIGGLKCATRVESSNIALGVGTKSYQTNCNYFDNQEGAKNIHIDYRYTYTHSGTKYDSDSQSSSVTPEAMQRQFKQDMKAIFDSLVIHDMDREQMVKEGLLHNKHYDAESEFR